MTEVATAERVSLIYQNPVWPGYLADPFVFRASDGFYYAYGTGPAADDGKRFPCLRSSNLVDWEARPNALLPLKDCVNYWAPEVAEKDGCFYMFYSATTQKSDEHHRLRVATSATPDGPFVDSGKLLVPEVGFSIDGHPFFDVMSGKWFLFFATDYTDDAPYGTGLAVIQLGDDLLSTVGQAKCIVRASCPWQVYERDRDYKGRRWAEWNCIEGPFVLFHDGVYYCLYSGGAWQTENYGVGFATATNPMGPWKDDMARHGPTVVKGIPGRVIGPGHNSVVTGPDGRTQYVAYHAWDLAKSARRLCIDPLIWTPDGPRCDGPSDSPRTIATASSAL